MNILFVLQCKCAVAAALGDAEMFHQAHHQFEIIVTAKEVK